MNDKKTQIMNAAIVLFAQEGVGVPTARIAREAGVSNGTLFNYFDTKQTLIDEVYLYIKSKAAREIVSDMDMSADVKDILFSVWRDYIHWARKNSKEDRVMALLFTSQVLSAAIVKKGEELFSKIFEAAEKAVKDNILIKDVSHDLVSEIAHGQMAATVSYIQRNRLKKSEIDETIDTSFNMFWRGIAV